MVTGLPIRREVFTASREEGLRAFALDPGRKTLLIIGGSQGAASLSELSVRSFGVDGPTVLHLSGERDFERLRDRVSRPDYRLLPYTDHFGAALAASDLVLARAGGSVWEVAAAGVPALLVPYPHATADHQTKNAAFFEAAGAAVLVPEPEVARVPELVRALLADNARLLSMGDAMRRVARPQAADEIAEEVVALAAARR